MSQFREGSLNRKLGRPNTHTISAQKIKYPQQKQYPSSSGLDFVFVTALPPPPRRLSQLYCLRLGHFVCRPWHLALNTSNHKKVSNAGREMHVTFGAPLTWLCDFQHSFLLHTHQPHTQFTTKQITKNTQKPRSERKIFILYI